MLKKNISRRDALKIALCGATVSVLSPTTLAMPSSAPRMLAMNNLHTGESLESRYFDGAKYIQSELARLNTLCRDHRRNETHAMDKKLFDQVTEIQKLLGVQTEVLIISGYRSPATNASLRQQSSGVARKSYHMLGQAIDFRLDGVKLSHVREAALSLKAGGVGYYPRSQFVHIDTGPVRSW